MHLHLPGVLRPGGGVQPDHRIGDGEHVLLPVVVAVVVEVVKIDRGLPNGRVGVFNAASDDVLVSVSPPTVVGLSATGLK